MDRIRMCMPNLVYTRASMERLYPETRAESPTATKAKKAMLTAAAAEPVNRFLSFWRM
jgi:hypothetical protein